MWTKIKRRSRSTYIIWSKIMILQHLWSPDKKGGRSVKHMQFNMNNWTKLLNKNSIEQVSFPQHIYSPSYLLNLTVLNTYNWNNIVLNHFTIELLANWKFNNWTSPIEQLHDLSEQWVFWTISNSFINNWTTIYWTKVICLIALVQ